MKRICYLLLLPVCFLFLFNALPVNAYGEKDYAPPQLDDQQSTKWINTLPWSRPYLARMWDVDQRTAELYGAQYQMPVCGLAASDPTGKAPASATISIPKGDSFYEYLVPQGHNTNTGWNREIPYIAEFEPIPIDYSKPQEDILISLAYYEYPPMLDRYQGVRWGQSLPSARMYLARLWDIPEEIAIQYGAIY